MRTFLLLGEADGKTSGTAGGTALSLGEEGYSSFAADRLAWKKGTPGTAGSIESVEGATVSGAGAIDVASEVQARDRTQEHGGTLAGDT
eukprot:13410459-Alexandrium_andersonii.AAC.1